MTKHDSGPAAGATPTRPDGRQRPRPVIALIAPSDSTLCHDLVQALSVVVPTAQFRINPDPLPDGAFCLWLDLDPSGPARLRWEGGGLSPAVTRDSLSEPEFARLIVAMSGGLLTSVRAKLTYPHRERKN